MGWGWGVGGMAGKEGMFPPPTPSGESGTEYRQKHDQSCGAFWSSWAQTLQVPQRAWDGGGGGGLRLWTRTAEAPSTLKRTHSSAGSYTSARTKAGGGGGGGGGLRKVGQANVQLEHPGGGGGRGLAQGLGGWLC